MKTYWGGGIVPRILDHGTIRRWVVSFTSRSLYPAPIGQEAGWAPVTVRTRWILCRIWYKFYTANILTSQIVTDVHLVAMYHYCGRHTV